jgi:hypothetical protein
VHESAESDADIFPKLHSVQAEAPLALLYWPWRHTPQLVALLELWYVPLEHATHWVLGPVSTVTSSNFPGVQLKQFEEPTSFVTQPLGQVSQPVGSKLTAIGFPSSCQEYNMNVPISQSKQAEELVKDHFPAAQTEQNPWPSPDFFPTMHALQVSIGK